MASFLLEDLEGAGIPERGGVHPVLTGFEIFFCVSLTVILFALNGGIGARKPEEPPFGGKGNA